MFKILSFRFVLSVGFLLNSLSSLAQNVFTSEKAHYKFNLPSDKWKIVAEPDDSLHEQAELVYGERSNGLLKIKKETFDHDVYGIEMVTREIIKKSRFLPGFNEGEYRIIKGKLNSLCCPYSFIRNGTKMAGQLYIVQSTYMKYYSLSFTGPFDKLTAIQNEMDAIVSSFKTK